MILKAGIPRISISLAKTISQFGHTHGVIVKSFTMRVLKHLTKAPLPPFLYLYKGARHLLQYISTDFSGAFLFGFATVNNNSWLLVFF